MRLAIVNHNLGSGGAEKLIYDMALELKKKKIKFSIILLTSIGDIYGKKLQEEEIDVIYLSDKWDIYSPKNILKLKKILEDYNVIHTHTYSAQLWTSFASIFLNKNKKYITTEHSTENNRRGKILFKLLDKWMYSKYSTIIAINSKVKEKLEEWIGENYNFKIIENGVNIQKILKIEGYDKEFLGYSKKDRIICVVARLIKMKSHETIIEALKILPNKYKCIFLGEGNYRKDLENLVSENGLNERIKFLGYKEDVFKIIKACDLSVLASKYEGMPLSVLEAMCFVPFIGSNVPGIRELVIDAGELFEYKNSKELALKIEKIMDNVEYYNEIKEKCYRRTKKYELDKTIQKYLKEYL